MKSLRAQSVSRPHLNSLARALVRAGHLSEARARTLSLAAHDTPGRLAAVLVQNGVMDARTLARFASEQLGYPLFDLDALDTRHLPLALLDEALRSSQAVLPLSCHAGRLSVAMADPTDDVVIDALRHATAMPLEVVVVDIRQLHTAWTRA